MPSRRILITGLASVWGGRLAHQLEHDPQVETVVGIDTADPQLELERTEFVRTPPEPQPLARIIRAAGIDTVVETTLVGDGRGAAPGRTRAVDPKATLSLLEAAARAGVRKVVVKSSAEYYGSGRDAPAFFTEDTPPLGRPRTPAQRELARAERALADYGAEHGDTTVTVLRCAAPVGGGLRSAELSLLALPVIPGILGFDPRWQFVHEDDVVGALAHAVSHSLPGAYNLAGDGVLALSEVAGLLSKPLLPVLPPWGMLFTAGQVRRFGIPVPVEVLRELRYGRGLDNRKLKASGYLLRYTSRETVLKLRAEQRLRPLLGSGQPDGYRYAPEVEEFLRRSPSVQPTHQAMHQARAENAAAPSQGQGGGYIDLTEGELLEVIPSLETASMLALRDHEAAGPARPTVLAEIDQQLALRETMDSS